MLQNQGLTPNLIYLAENLLFLKIAIILIIIHKIFHISFPILIIFFQGLEIFHYLSLLSIPKYFIIKTDTLLLLLITIDLFSASDLIACRSPLESLE